MKTKGRSKVQQGMRRGGEGLTFNLVKYSDLDSRTPTW